MQGGDEVDYPGVISTSCQRSADAPFSGAPQGGAVKPENAFIQHIIQ